jgi:protocatechuate 3,4-dioxygenase beta subunit
MQVISQVESARGRKEQCQPVLSARVDFWQADSAGQYDNQGYTLRGYQWMPPYRIKGCTVIV